MAYPNYLLMTCLTFTITLKALFKIKTLIPSSKNLVLDCTKLLVLENGVSKKMLITKILIPTGILFDREEKCYEFSEPISDFFYKLNMILINSWQLGTSCCLK